MLGGIYKKNLLFIMIKKKNAFENDDKVKELRSTINYPCQQTHARLFDGIVNPAQSSAARWGARGDTIIINSPRALSYWSHVLWGKAIFWKIPRYLVYF